MEQKEMSGLKECIVKMKEGQGSMSVSVKYIHDRQDNISKILFTVMRKMYTLTHAFVFPLNVPFSLLPSSARSKASSLL